MGKTNQLIKDRLDACLAQLLAAYFGGTQMSSASKGLERELFVEIFLKNVLPPAYRFGTGDITDSKGDQSGQVDLVIEHSSIPSFPLVGTSIPRLYLAEGVGAAIEVKSDLSTQWEEVLRTARGVGRLRRGRDEMIPFIVVGYRGWSTPETLERKLASALSDGVHIHGALTLEPAQYLGLHLQTARKLAPITFDGFPALEIPQVPEPAWHWLHADGPMALWALLLQVHRAVTSLLGSPDALVNYLNITAERPPRDSTSPLERLASAVRRKRPGGKEKKAP